MAGRKKISSTKVLGRIGHHMDDEFGKHARSARDHFHDAQLDIYIHEDLDQLQALDVAELEKNPDASPVAWFSFNGSLGQSRIRMTNLLCIALNESGYRIRHRGITRF